MQCKGFITEAWSVVAMFMILTSSTATRYEPNWASLDSRPLPAWYDESKIGIFLHWGVFSVPSYNSAWFWYQWKGLKTSNVVEFMEENYKPDFTYADFAPDFKAEFYDPLRWADIFNASGAKYVVLVTKHHEGFTNWPSKYSWNWNAKDVGPNRDLVGDLASAIRKTTDMHFGVYHSLFEWFHPLYMQDKANNYTTQKFVAAKTMPELYELVNTYKPDVVWSDGDWMVDDFYWNATQFLAWLYNDSPVKDTVVTNDRWGKNIRCKHGGFWNCEDRYVPEKLPKHKWENCMTLDKHGWTFRRDTRLSEIYTMNELIALLAKTVSLGGNLLVNAGPTAYGTINPIYEERLRQMGQWLAVNGEAIYSTHPWTYQNDTTNPDVWYTSRKKGSGTVVYAILLKWLPGTTLQLGAPVVSDQTSITLLGYSGAPFQFVGQTTQGVTVTVPTIPFSSMPCQWGWVFKLLHLKNQ
ncbi:alpha-L-fucosidase-like [Babylonia areolata]|uniref:alpha-L-fucosidase-like n=1 Tax=Babylonia areolata TaxID=304850 RepID=UPI003FD2A6B6